jgi:hypothetical protein
LQAYQDRPAASRLEDLRVPKLKHAASDVCH